MNVGSTSRHLGQLAYGLQAIRSIHCSVEAELRFDILSLLAVRWMGIRTLIRLCPLLLRGKQVKGGQRGKQYIKALC